MKDLHRCLWEAASAYKIIVPAAKGGQENALGKENADEHTDIITTDGNPLAVGLVGYPINLLEVVGVRDDLVIGDNILEPRGQRRVYVLL